MNRHGQLGDGTGSSRNAPVQVKGLAGVSAIAVGSSHTLALRKDGTVWAWGSNKSGQLGIGKNAALPVQVSGLTGVSAIAVRSSHTIALKKDGTVWAWGSNKSGQLGIGNTGYRFTPAQVFK
jgi:alpha-tubulin suppressor-like RCC1 family protein